MTLEKLAQQLAADGWHLWHLGDWPRDGWHATLWTDRDHPAIQDRQGRRMCGTRGGFSRRGEGATALAAVQDAARDICQPKSEDVLDLSFLLS